MESKFPPKTKPNPSANMDLRVLGRTIKISPQKRVLRASSAIKAKNPAENKSRAPPKAEMKPEVLSKIDLKTLARMTPKMDLRTLSSIVSSIPQRKVLLKQRRVSKEVKDLAKQRRKAMNQTQQCELDLMDDVLDSQPIRKRDAISASLNYLAYWQGEGEPKEVLNQAARTFKTLKKARKVVIVFREEEDVTDQTLKNLFISLQRLSYLRSLELDFSLCLNITDQCLSSLAECLKRFKFLQSLNLNFNGCPKITDQGLNTLRRCLKKLKSLRSVHLDFFQISEESQQNLSQSLKRLCSLRAIKLNFDDYRLTVKGLRNFDDGLKRLSSLQSFELIVFACQRMTNKGLQKLMLGLQRLSALKSLKLGLPNCHIKDESLRILGENLRSLRSLQHLGLSFCCEEVTEEGFRMFCEDLELLSSMQSINFKFQRCDFTDQDLKNLFSSLKKLKSLQSLHLGIGFSKRTTHKGIKMLGKTLQTFSSLRSFNLLVNCCDKIEYYDLEDLQTRLEELGLLEDVIVCHEEWNMTSDYF